MDVNSPAGKAIIFGGLFAFLVVITLLFSWLSGLSLGVTAAIVGFTTAIGMGTALAMSLRKPKNDS